MATKKDLVEAHTFNRRRLITSFLSGAPGGREVEPVNYARVLVAGLILAALVVAGAAVSGFLKPATPKNWDNAMIVAKDGSRFVSSKDVLYPIANTASARLFAASDGSLNVLTVSTEEIAKRKVGVQIGIPGAPDSLPTTASLVETGWTSCVNARGAVRTVIARDAKAGVTDDSAVLVKDAGSSTSYLVADGHRYQLPPGGAGSSQVRALQLDGMPVPEAPTSWLALFALGSPVGPFSVNGFGSKIDTGVSGLTRVGQPVTVDAKPYVLVRSHGRAALLKLTTFADEIYRSAAQGGLQPVRLQASDVASMPTVANADFKAYPADWPTGAQLVGSDVLCAGLTGSGDDPRSTELVVPAADSDAEPADSDTTDSVEVQTGKGALVTASSGGAKAPGLFLIDSTGTRFAVGGTGDYATAQSRLGYGSVDPAGVPAGWLNLFAAGPDLTVTAAKQAIKSGGSGAG